jgi:hypothetical protein
MVVGSLNNHTKTPTPNPQTEITALEECKKQLEDEKTSIEQEINSLAAQITDLKTTQETKNAPDQQ